MLKLLFQCLLKILFRVEVIGLENFHKAGDRAVIVCNHVSLLDPLILAAFLPGKVTFAINTHVAKKWLFRPIVSLAKVFPLDPMNPLSIKAIINYIQSGHKTVIFPEGRLTTTGSLMKVYDGTGMVADKTKANILPIIISGAEYTHFSRLQHIVKLRWFPKITVTILPHTRIEHEDDLKGKARRKLSGQLLTDILRDSVFAASHYRQSLCSAVLEARQIHGGKKIIAEDVLRKPISYNTLMTHVVIISKLLARISKKGEHVGVLLPTSIKAMEVILGLQWQGRIPAMLNFSMGSVSMLAACRTGNIKTVITSRKFIEVAKLTNDIKSLSGAVTVLYLEDLAKSLTIFDKLLAVFQTYFVGSLFFPCKQHPDDIAVILFTSGSEGTPKGVALSHSNVIGNLKQLKARYDFNGQDVVLNFLPMFHSFGFTVGTFLPLLHGMKCFYYPSPLHYNVIPELAYDIGATLIFGTNTFLAAYAKKANPYDFHKIRYVVAGAEKLQDSTRQLWQSKFGLRIMEGYGATETSPIAAVNTPYDCKEGTVGRLMPGMQHRLEAVPGIDKGGRLHLAGPNIMKGYFLMENPGVLVPPKSIYGADWYDTGDIVDIDSEGFVTIEGRSKRFAKISGEMVSLTKVELMAGKTWPSAQHAIVSLPDSKKGEQLILLTTERSAATRLLQSDNAGVSAIQFPKKLFVVEKMPLLGTGKIDYSACTIVAEQLLGGEINVSEVA